MDISSFVISNEENYQLQYDLFAVANHYGSMGFGHYISFGKNPIDKNWYEFDDSHVSSKREEDLVTSSAYVLFYRRRGLEDCLKLDEIYTKKFINFEDMIKNQQNNTNSTNVPNATEAVTVARAVITNENSNSTSLNNSAATHATGEGIQMINSTDPSSKEDDGTKSKGKTL
jgi:hypothetical protein